MLPTSGLHAFIRRGPNTGTLLFPHRHRDGCYVVSKTRYEKDYVRLSSVLEVIEHLEKGFSLRMSNPDEGVNSPSLIEPEKIYRPILT